MAFLRQAGVTSLDEFPTYRGLVKAAAEKRIKVFCADLPPALYYLYKMDLEGDFRRSAPLYIGELHRAVHKGNHALLSLVEEGFSRITPSENREIERRWLGTPIQRMIYYQYGAYALAAALGAGALLLGLVLLAVALRRRIRARTVELRATMEELRRSEAQFRLLAENADDVIWTMDLQGRFTYISPSVQKLRGYTPQEVMDQSLEKALTPDSLLLVQGLIDELSRRIGEGQRDFDLPPQEVEQPCKDGSTVWTEVIVTPLFDEGGSFLRLLGITRDISERRRREDAQRALEAQMLQAQKLESLGVLAGGIAHDFNNILTSILGNAELAQGDLPAASPARERIRSIDEASRRAADLCRQMLAYSGRARVVVESVDISALVRGMTHMVQVSVSKKATLRSALPGRPPPGDGGCDADPPDRNEPDHQRLGGPWRGGGRRLRGHGGQGLHGGVPCPDVSREARCRRGPTCTSRWMTPGSGWMRPRSRKFSTPFSRPSSPAAGSDWLPCWGSSGPTRGQSG